MPHSIRYRERPGVTNLGYLRVIVQKKTLNLEKTTSIVLSVLSLIYAVSLITLFWALIL